MRMDPGRHPHGMATRGRRSEVDRLHRRAPPVVEGSVGHRQPCQPGHHGLVLEDGLQDALGHFGLVRGVRGDELRPPRQGAGHRGDLVVVGAATGEADQPVRAGAVLLPERLQMGQDVGFADAVGQLERPLQLECLGHCVE